MGPPTLNLAQKSSNAGPPRQFIRGSKPPVLWLPHHSPENRSLSTHQLWGGNYNRKGLGCLGRPQRAVPKPSQIFHRVPQTNTNARSCGRSNLAQAAPPTGSPPVFFSLHCTPPNFSGYFLTKDPRSTDQCVPPHLKQLFRIPVTASLSKPPKVAAHSPNRPKR